MKKIISFILLLFAFSAQAQSDQIGFTGLRLSSQFTQVSGNFVGIDTSLSIPSYYRLKKSIDSLATVFNSTLSGYSLTSHTHTRSSITDFGTGISTALGVNVGTSGSVVVNGGVLGTPSSGNFSSGTFTWPTFNQNTTGTASNLSGTPALPNGTTATTQATGDNTTKIATDAFVIDAIKYGKIYDQSVTVVAGTNTTSEEVLAYKMIPAGTLQVGDRVEIRALFVASSGTASKTCKVKVHSASSVGGTAFSTTANTSSTSTHVHNTGFAVVASSGANNLVAFMPGGQALMTGIISAGSQVATLPIANDIYIQLTTTKATGTDVISLYMYDIKILRP